MTRIPPPARQRREPQPASALDRKGLEALALSYAGRYLTTRARLAAYLRRKLRERPGPEDLAAAIPGLVERMAELGYVDDEGFARARTSSLARRGYGLRRAALALHQAGVAEEDSTEALTAYDEEGAWEALLRYASRRRLGRFGPAGSDLRARQRAMAALVRAGHPPALAAKFLKENEDECANLILPE